MDFPWTLKGRRQILDKTPFGIEELDLIHTASGAPLPHPYYRVTSRSWCNVVALTPDRRVILVEQPRAGILASTLEIPGGNIDAGEDPKTAALRELEEETGYRAARIRSLGSVHPNPAIMDNTLHMFLAEDCEIPADRRHFPDATEEIQLHLVTLERLEELLQAGRLQNALVNLTILTAQKYALKT